MNCKHEQILNTFKILHNFNVVRASRSRKFSLKAITKTSENISVYKTSNIAEKEGGVLI